jgi:hypothetical protein
MSETTEEDGLREILERLHDAGYTRGDNQWSGDMGTLITPDEAEQSIRQYFAAGLPEKTHNPNHAGMYRAGYNQALDDCRRAIEGKA